MTKFKLKNIEILEHCNDEVSQLSANNTSSLRSSQLTKRNSTIELLEKLPLSGKLLSLTGLLMLLFGIAFYQMVEPQLGLLYVAFLSTVLSGFGFVSLGFIKQKNSKKGLSTISGDSTPEIVNSRINKIKASLSNKSDEHTVENLVRASEMTEKTVVETLLKMQERGLISEELNLQSGEWYYVLSTKGLEEHWRKKSMTLQDRQRALSSVEGKGRQT